MHRHTVRSAGRRSDHGGADILKRSGGEDGYAAGTVLCQSIYQRSACPLYRKAGGNGRGVQDGSADRG